MSSPQDGGEGGEGGEGVLDQAQRQWEEGSLRILGVLHGQQAQQVRRRSGEEEEDQSTQYRQRQHEQDPTRRHKPTNKHTNKDKSKDRLYHQREHQHNHINNHNPKHTCKQEHKHKHSHQLDHVSREIIAHHPQMPPLETAGTGSEHDFGIKSMNTECDWGLSSSPSSRSSSSSSSCEDCDSSSCSCSSAADPAATSPPGPTPASVSASAVHSASVSDAHKYDNVKSYDHSACDENCEKEEEKTSNDPEIDRDRDRARARGDYHEDEYAMNQDQDHAHAHTHADADADADSEDGLHILTLLALARETTPRSNQLSLSSFINSSEDTLPRSRDSHCQEDRGRRSRDRDRDADSDAAGRDGNWNDLGRTKHSRFASESASALNPAGDIIGSNGEEQCEDDDHSGSHNYNHHDHDQEEGSSSDSLPSSPLSSTSFPASFLSSMSDNGSQFNLSRSMTGITTSIVALHGNGNGHEHGHVNVNMNMNMNMDVNVNRERQTLLRDEEHSGGRNLEGRGFGQDDNRTRQRVALSPGPLDDVETLQLPPSWIQPCRITPIRRTTVVPAPTTPTAAAAAATLRNGQSDTDSGTYIFSRSHWAVEEARRRTEEQGDDLSLVLPSLTLPEGSLGAGMSASAAVGSNSFLGEVEKSPMRFNGQETDSHEDGLGVGTRIGSRPRPRPLHILLSGTNRTVNAFLKQLIKEDSVDVYRLRPQDSSGRSIRPNQRGGIFDVGVFQKRVKDTTLQTPSSTENSLSGANTGGGGEGGGEDSTADESDAGSGSGPSVTPAMRQVNPDTREWSSSMILLAVVHVVGKGQEGNVSRAVDLVETCYRRLDRLLVPSIDLPPSVDQDLTRLIEMWVENGGGEKNGVEQHSPGGAGREGNTFDPSPPAVLKANWYDLGIVTGDSRYLANDESGRLRQLTDILPCICWPSSLESRLGYSDADSPFVRLGSGGKWNFSPATSSGFTPDSVSSLISALQDQDSANSLLEQSVTGFIRYRQYLHDDEPFSSAAKQPLSDVSHLSAAPTSLPSSEPSGSTISDTPIPTVSRLNPSPDWEVGLSRRHAARRMLAKPADKQTQGSPATTLGLLADRRQTIHGFFEDMIDEEDEARLACSTDRLSQSQRRGRPSFISVIFLAPLFALRSIFGFSHSSCEDDLTANSGRRRWSSLFSIACLTVATAGIGCFWLTST